MSGDWVKSVIDKLEKHESELLAQEEIIRNLQERLKMVEAKCNEALLEAKGI